MTAPEEGHGDLMNSHDGVETNGGGSPTPEWVSVQRCETRAYRPDAGLTE